MSASTAIALSAVAIATSAQHEARVAGCKAIVQSFDSKAATVAQAREYADCIMLLHPNPMPIEGIIVLKVLFVLMLNGIAIGAWRGMGREFVNDWQDRLLAAFLWGLCLPFAVTCVAGIVVGIVWLFT